MKNQNNKPKTKQTNNGPQGFFFPNKKKKKEKKNSTPKPSQFSKVAETPSEVDI